MSEVRFTVEHEWLRLEADGLITVGITRYAQEALGDVVFVQLPELGGYSAGQEAATVESVKAASSITMPLDGEVVEVNAVLEDSPELINEDAEGQAWFFRMRPADAGQFAEQLDADAYARLTESEE